MPSVYDTIIIGGGPAGITAAIYAARKRMNFLLLAEDIGGQVLKSSVVENYTGYESITGADLAVKFKEHLEKFKFDSRAEKVKNIARKDKNFSVETQQGTYEGKTVIIATGARPRKLNIPGENEFEGKGITYCATCDAPLFSGKDVAVIGGGNTGLEATMELMKIANKIYLIDIIDRLTGDKVLIEKVKESPKVEIFYNAAAVAVTGGKFAEKLSIRQEGQEKDLAVRGIFVSIGYIPNAEFVKGFLEINQKGEIEIKGSRQETSVPGVFAAGDCTDTPYKQIVIAAGEGCKSVLAAFDYLNAKE